MRLLQPIKYQTSARRQWLVLLSVLKLLIYIGIGTTLNALMSPVIAQPTCEFFIRPELLNTQSQEDGVIRLGRLRDRPYLVILPNADDTDLTTIRPCIPDAYLTRSRLGRYLQVGIFARRSQAENLAQTLRVNGFRARVIHRHGLGH